MKNLFRVFLTLTLVLSLVLSATSCDLLASGDIDAILGILGDGNDVDDNVNDGNDGGNELPDITPGDESHNHEYTAVRTAPTCTEKGKVTYTCECGRSFTTDLSPSGHKYDKNVCVVCGDVKSGEITDETPEEKPEEKPDDGNGTPGDDIGEGTVFAGGILYLPNETDPVTSDPYVNVDVDAFYANYTPAISYMDSYYRTQHNLMSGSIETQNATPTFAAYQPTLDGNLVRNTTYIFSQDGLVYYVVDGYGNIVNKIYKCGAYVTLEEVAAYVFAFGTYPANHSANKKDKPTSSVWGKYLRVNHTNFTGDTSKYPYEPELPRISGCGGDLQYWEMDIGTTGTDCDPSYTAKIYNDGTKITRGAARIVYTWNDLNENGMADPTDIIFVFYTYNHYNDFQEYLNYYGGWGEMFGNITGGGKLSSKYDYNPTPYVPVVNGSIEARFEESTPSESVILLAWIDRRVFELITNA